MTTSEEPDIWVTHPEIHHYTDLRGVYGIWTTNTLRATRFDCLNDSTEVRLFHDLLRDQLYDANLKKMKAAIADGKTSRELLAPKGGLEALARDNANNLIDQLFALTFNTDRNSETNFIPFIVSFCSHCEKTADYERNNGLLSQWRAYGREAPCSVVFDTKKLCDRLFETKIPGSFCDVIYSNERERGSGLVAPLIKALDQALGLPLKLAEPILDELVERYVRVAPRYKHMGFFEEKEVRIIAIFSKNWRQLPEASDFAGGLVAESHSPQISPMGDRIVYRAHLFSGRKGQLPIKRIIVGPGGRQRAAEIELRKLVDDEVDIVLSQTPFLG